MDVERFRKICGLLGSEHDGERATAALKATTMLRAGGLGWGDVSAKQTTDPNPNGLMGALEEVRRLKSMVNELAIRNRLLVVQIDAWKRQAESNKRQAERTTPPVTMAERSRKAAERSRRALHLREGGKTLREIAQEFGVSQQRVRQLIARAIRDREGLE